MYSTGIDWDSGSMACSTVAAAFCDALAKLCRRGPVRHLKQWECGTFAAGDGFANTTPDITCEACRAAIRNDKSAPKGYDPWLEAIKAAMVELREKFPAPVYDTQPAPTPAELYTRFRETVERVVREEAPNARVVTDVTPAILRERPAQFLVDFEWGQYRRQWSHNFNAPVTQFESSIRQHCECALREAGARAMGRK